MQNTLSRLLIALAIAAPGAALAKEPATARGSHGQANEAATSRHYASLIAGAEPKLAELTMFFTQMPKGGDLHHHYSGAIYVEQYLDFLDRQGLCVNKQSYRVETDKAVIVSERSKPAKERNCLSSAEVYADDTTWRELVQRWSNKDFDNHGAIQPPPDRLFFQTFGYFGPVSNANFEEGLQALKKRAIAENVSYIETMFKMAPFVPDAEFDARAWQLANDDAALQMEMRKAMETLERDPAFARSIADFVARIEQAAAGIDDERFTMRYQTYVLRLLNPSQVFSSMVAAFKAASAGGKIVGVNIVGQESTHVSMRDYTLHMKMFGFLKKVYPNVKVAMHAGELAMGEVPPEGLKFHIDQALTLAGADRIGHGLDLAHEANAAGILGKMRASDIPVEINLTSNSFISGIKGENHPVTLYRKYGVPYVISTDDAGVTRHTLSQEYVLFASRYKPDYAEMKKTSYNSIRYAFLQAEEKTRLTRQLDARFAAFEAGMARLSKTVVPAPRSTK
jgi:adenosine deaminase/adenosine deaminase CECR1